MYYRIFTDFCTQQSSKSQKIGSFHILFAKVINNTPPPQSGRFATADLWVARLLMVCVFLPAHLQVFVAIGTCSWFVFRTVQLRIWPQKSQLLAAALLGSGYLLYLFGAFLSPPQYRHYAFQLVERMASLLAMPVVFAFIAQSFRLLIVAQLRFFVYGCLLVAAYGHLWFVWHYVLHSQPQTALSHVLFRNSFEDATGIHPTYMGVYLVFALCITAITWQPVGRKVWVRYAMLATLLVFTLSLFAKSPLLALGIIMMGFVWQQRRQLSTYKVPAAILAGVGVVATLFIPFIRQRAAEMLGLFRQSPSDNLIQNSVHMRRLIWNTDVTLLKKYWLTGMGPGRVLQAMHQHFFFHSLYRGYPVGYYDPHSQYFAFWLAFGVVGILVFVAMLLAQVRNALLHRNTLYACLLVVLIITFFTETMLARQQGVLFYAIFTALLFFAGSKPRPSHGQ